MSICMSTGQAAGIAAALCVEQGKTPRTLAAKDVQAELLKCGATLFDEKLENYFSRWDQTLRLNYFYKNNRTTNVPRHLSN